MGLRFLTVPSAARGARDRALAALALNARAELTLEIARTGLESLDAAERAELPELDLEDPEHRPSIFGLFGALTEHAAELGLENVYIAQTVWDETMADTSARWLAAAEAPARLLIFAGVVHRHESAIPRRITRRSGLDVLRVGTIFESQLGSPAVVAEGYDLLVVLEDGPSESVR